MKHPAASSVVVAPPIPTSSIATKRVAVSTLGCKVNAFESELIAQSLQSLQWQVVDARTTADLYIVNTCTVTREADRQSRQEVRRAVRQNPDALVVVTGCYAQMDAEACAAIPGVDLVLGNDRKLNVAAFLPALESRELPLTMVGDMHGTIHLPDQLLAGYEGHTRAYVQVQQGCDQGCTFCIIHVARGPSRSLPPTQVRRQVEQLIENGYREIVLCGVDLGAYGADFGSRYGLVELLVELVALPGEFRLRLSSIDPVHLNTNLVALLATEQRICPHIHLSMQSSNTLILKRMKRRYTRETLYERIGALRAALPHLVLSADVMVGFPTETDAQFADTTTAVRDLQIAFPHVFSYSERPGTPAARIPKQVPVPVRKDRAAQVRALGIQIRTKLYLSRVGTRAQALVESDKGVPQGYRRGRCADYLPVLIPASEAPIGTFVDVTLIGQRDSVLVGRGSGWDASCYPATRQNSVDRPQRRR